MPNNTVKSVRLGTVARRGAFTLIELVAVMVVIILLASKKSVMGAYTASRPIRVLGWLATGIMGVAAACMFLPG